MKRIKPLETMLRASATTLLTLGVVLGAMYAVKPEAVRKIARKVDEGGQVRFASFQTWWCC